MTSEVKALRFNRGRPGSFSGLLESLKQRNMQCAAQIEHISDRMRVTEITMRILDDSVRQSERSPATLAASVRRSE